MKFTSLSANPNSPCSILKWKSLIIMLDCSLDQTTSMAFLPLPVIHSPHFASLPPFHCSKASQDPQLENELKECGSQMFVDGVPEFRIPDLSKFEHNLKEIDVILISSYRTMLALPFITERTGFSGLIFATAPSIKFGQMYMEELVNNIERNPKLKRVQAWKRDYKTLQLPLVDESSDPLSWRTIYSREEIKSCIGKIKSCTFTESNDIYGLLTVTPTCSGHLLGSCNWLIESGPCKISYISGSSVFRTHPKTIQTEQLENSNLVILNSVQIPVNKNEDLNVNGLEFVTHIRNCVSSGGNVLIPCYASGAIYEQLDFVVKHLESHGLSAVPIYFISSIAEASLAYSNIAGEWLREDYMSKVYSMEEPFNHGFYLKNYRIRIFKDISDRCLNENFRQPCVLFAGHPSLRYGDVVHFIELWGQNSKNLMLLTECDFPIFQALKPFQPLHMKIIQCSFQTCLSFSQANQVLSQIKPKNLLIPHRYSEEFIKENEPMLLNERNVDEVSIVDNDDCDMKIIKYKLNETIKIDIKNQFENVEVDEKLATTLQIFNSNIGNLTNLTALLNATDNQYRLEKITKHNENGMKIDEGGDDDDDDMKGYKRFKSKTHKDRYGQVDVTKMVELLSNAGFGNVHLEPRLRGSVIRAPAIRASIFIDDLPSNNQKIVVEFDSIKDEKDSKKDSIIDMIDSFLDQCCLTL